MATVFISHSSQDEQYATELIASLKSHDIGQIFLAIDKDNGIKPGAEWEKTLYRELDNAQAILLVLTPKWHLSKWCFAEYIQARALRKPIFPLNFEYSIEDKGIAPDCQHLDLSTDRESGLEQLAIQLRQKVLDVQGGFEWDPRRSPYPGLTAFQEDDAAVFLGRGRSIETCIGHLREFRFYEKKRLLIVKGPSGSGKSSLVRAGIVPNLKREDQWLVVKPFLPLDHPFDELATAIAISFGSSHEKWDRKGILDVVNSAAKDKECGRMVELAEDLCVASGQQTASVLLVIDQFEELLVHGNNLSKRDTETQTQFLTLLRRLLEMPTSPYIVIATLRSDFFDLFETDERIGRVPKVPYQIAPLSTADFLETIQKPAEIAGQKMEQALAQSLLHDTGNQASALPLLQHVLSQLWEQRETAGLTVRAYEELGTLTGIIGREANRLYDDVLDKAEKEECKQILLRLVQTGFGTPDTKCRVSRETFGDSDITRNVIGKLVKAGLVTTGGENASSNDDCATRYVELSHEIIIGSLSKYSDWIKEYKEVSEIHRRLTADASLWNKDRNPKYLLHKTHLAEADRFQKTFPEHLTPQEKDYFDASVKHWRKERREHWLQILNNMIFRRRLKRRVRLIEAGSVLVVFIVIATIGIYVSRHNEDKVAETLWNRGVEARDTDNDPLKASHYFTHAAAMTNDKGLEQDGRTAAEFLARPIKLVNVSSLQNLVEGAVIDSSGEAVIAWSQDGTIYLWNGREKKWSQEFQHNGKIMDATVNWDGQEIFLWNIDGTVDIRSIAEGKVLRSEGVGGKLSFIVFSEDKSRFLSVTSDGMTATVWNTAKFEALSTIDLLESIGGATFSPDGSKILMWNNRSKAYDWNYMTEEKPRYLFQHSGLISGAIFSRDARRIVSWGDYKVRFWNLYGEEICLEDEKKCLDAEMHHSSGINGIAFDTNNEEILIWSDDATVRIWDSFTAQPLTPPLMHEGPIQAARFTRRGDQVIAWSNEAGSVRIWDTDTVRPLKLSMVSEDKTDKLVRKAAFVKNKPFVATLDTDNAVQIWHEQTHELIGTSNSHGKQFSEDGTRLLAQKDKYVYVQDVLDSDVRIRIGEFEASSFSGDGSRILTWSRDGKVHVWNSSNGDQIASLAVAGHKPLLGKAVLSQDNRRLMTWTDQNEGIVWDVQTEKPVNKMTFEKPLKGAAFVPNAARVFIWMFDVTDSTGFWAYKYSNRFTPLKEQPGPIGGVAISYDGHRLVTWKDNSAYLWDLKRNKNRTTNPSFIKKLEHIELFKGVTFINNGSFLTWHEDNEVNVWDSSAGRLLSPALKYTSLVKGVDVDENGQQFLAWSGDGTLRIWRVGIENTITRRDLLLFHEVRTGIQLDIDNGSCTIIPEAIWRCKRDLVDHEPKFKLQYLWPLRRLFRECDDDQASAAACVTR